MKVQMVGPWLTIAQVAEIVQVSSRTVERWVSKRLIASSAPSCGTVRIAKTDLEAFMKRTSRVAI